MRRFAIGRSLTSVNCRSAVDPETDAHAWTTTLRLADRFDLTLYDAAYLELGLRRSATLATLDGALRSATASLKVPLLGV